MGVPACEQEEPSILSGCMKSNEIIIKIKLIVAKHADCCPC